MAATYRASVIAAAPGWVMAAGIWLYTFRNLDYAQLVDSQYGLWQSLGREILTHDPLAAVLALHIQPPGLNILEAVDLLISPRSHLILGATFLGMLLLSLFMVVDTLVVCGLTRRAASIAGLLYAVLPATVIYSLWPFSTTPTMFGAALAIWGVARMRHQPVLGTAATCGGVLALLLSRSSFAWPFALCWLGILAVVVWRTSPARRTLRWQTAILGGTLLVVTAIQGHYLISFGLPTMTSWTGENLAKALVSSGSLTITQEAEAEIRQDPCEAALLDTLGQGPGAIWRPARFRSLPGCAELPALAPRGTAAWDSPDKDGAYDGGWSGNFNWSERLVASRVWTSVMQKVLAHRPSQLLSMALTTPTEGGQSGLGIYLGPSEDFPFVDPIREHYPLPRAGGLLSLLFAPTMLVLGLIGLVVSALRRESGAAYGMTLYFATGFLAYHVAISVLVEYGENMRFQAEATPVLVVAGFLGCSALLVSRGPSPHEEWSLGNSI